MWHVAALSETHIAVEGELVERGGEYTFFWKGLAAFETRRSGVQFAIKNRLVVNQLQECQVHISDRVPTLRLHLDTNNFLSVVSVYAPIMDKPNNLRISFMKSFQNVSKA